MPQQQQQQREALPATMISPPSQLKEDVRKAYNNIAPVYKEWTRPTYGLRMSYVKKLLSYFPDFKGDGPESGSVIDILELGCGAGTPCTQFLASHSAIAVTANDISDVQVSMAREHLPSSVNLIQADMMELQFDSQQFDAVIALYSIIHLPRDEQIIMLQRIFRWLKPGGFALVNFTGGEVASITNSSWLGGTEGTMYWSGWGADGIRKILTDTGFEMIIDEVIMDTEDSEEGKEDIPFLWVLGRKSSKVV